MKNLPVATEVPPMLAQALEREVGSQQTVPKMPMVVTDGILDASAVNPDFKIPAKLEFEDVCPATLALAARCAQDGVFAAPSIMFPGATGLYPATDFKKGDVVARVEPLSHKWVSIDDPSLEEDTGFRRVEIDLEYPSRNCKRMVCVGDPSRHPWANINLVTSPAAANLTPNVSAGNMGDDFLVLEAAHDIPAFSAELLWFANVNVSSEPAGAKKDASEPDASKPVQLGVSPQKVAPAPEAVKKEAPQSEVEQACDVKMEGAQSAEEAFDQIWEDLSNSESPAVVGAEKAGAKKKRQPLVDSNNVAEMSEEVAQLTKPEGMVHFVKPDRLFVTFQLPQHKLSTRPLYTVLGGDTRTNVTENIVLYDVTEKSAVYYKDDKKTLKQLIQNCSGTPSVYGRIVTADQKIVPNPKDGTDIWWCPPPDKLPLVKALLEVGCTPTFLMEWRKNVLAPCGASFVVPTITFSEKHEKSQFWPLRKGID